MKIIHTSDWHFGMPAGTDTYEACQRHFLSQLCALIRREQVGAVICAGDVFDSSVSNADAIRLYNEAATAICKELGAKFIVIAGNHDGAARLASCSELLEGAGLYVTGRLQRDVKPVLLDGGRTAVYRLPFFGRDEVIALFPEKKDQIRSQETAMQVVCDHIREQMEPGRCNIVVSHAYIVNAELSDSDRSASIGYATAVSKDVFAGFDYVALGHIHKPQQIAPHIRYSGSPIKYSFGAEEQQHKGVVLFDTETKQQEFIELPMLYDRLTVTGTYDEIMAREDIADNYLRLNVVDRYAGLELFSELRDRFPNLLELYGMSTEAEGSPVALTAEQLQSMDETDIMIKFLEENFAYTPDAQQIALFREVLADAEEEGDAQ